MLPYILLAFVIGIGACREDGMSIKTHRQWINWSWALFLIIVGFRYRHGDYGTYEWGYNNHIDVGSDFGYYWLNLICENIGLSFQVFVFLLTLVSVYAFRQTFKISPWPLFGLVVILGKIFTLYAMSGIRQYIAIALCWWAISELLSKNNRWKFFALVAIAYSMHASAIIILPMYFFRNMKFSYFNAFILLIMSIVVGYFSSEFFEYAVEGSDLIANRFGGYQKGTVGMNVLNYAENLLFLVVALMVRSRVVKKVPYYDFFIYMFIIYCGFLIVGNEIGIVKRLRDYYALAYAIIVPSFVYLFRSQRNLSKFVLVSYFVFLMFRSLYVYDSAFSATTYHKMIPYHSVLDMNSIESQQGYYYIEG